MTLTNTSSSGSFKKYYSSVFIISVLVSKQIKKFLYIFPSVTNYKVPNLLYHPLLYTDWVEQTLDLQKVDIL